MGSAGLSLPELGHGKALYVLVADAISEFIRENSLAPGDKLPSQNTLMKRYDVSQATVRQALLSLSNQGLITAHQGKGVFVARPKVLTDLSRPRIISRGDTNGIRFSYEFVGAELLFAPDRVAKLLEIDVQTQITRCRRRLRFGMRLLGLETANFPIDVVQTFSKDELHTGDYLEALSRSEKTAIATIDLSLEAGTISDFDADLLEKSPETIVLQRIEVCRNATNLPIFMTRTTLFADSVELSGRVTFDSLVSVE